jgi:hypothetical protein
MNQHLLTRYQAGERSTVWLEIGGLHESTLDSRLRADVQAVTLEMLRRVRHNLELIASRLSAIEFVFGEFDEHGRGFHGDEPVLRLHPVRPLEHASERLLELSGVVGVSLPLVFWLFAEQVGTVDFWGVHPGSNPIFCSMRR